MYARWPRSLPEADVVDEGAIGGPELGLDGDPHSISSLLRYHDVTRSTAAAIGRPTGRTPTQLDNHAPDGHREEGRQLSVLAAR